MKLIRFAQSTVFVSNDAGGHLLIDPGQYNLDPGRFTLDTFPAADIVVITHKHVDHFHLPLLEAMLAKRKATIVTNVEIAAILQAHGIACRTFGPGDSFEQDGFQLRGVVADHVVRGEEIVNFGVVVLADGQRFYHTSDTRFIDAGRLPDETKTTCVLLPISNRGVVMGFDDAAVFAKDLDATLVIPLHYDSPKDRDRVKPDDFAQYAASLGLNVKVLNFNETLEF